MFVRENNGTNMVKFRKIYFCKRAEFFRSLEPIKNIYIYIYSILLVPYFLEENN